MQPSTIEWLAAVLFGLAILHTFAVKWFEKLAHARPAHAGIWHLLGEVEVVFGFWALLLMVAMFALEGASKATQYIEGRNFTEPLFVFAIMVIAATRPILHVVTRAVEILARLLPLPNGLSFYLVTLSVVPLLGSFVTEPAAMTIAALILKERYYDTGISTRLMYATLGVLLVNISIGGTLTPFAAPPVLMVAGKWNWDFAYMMSTFGWKAALAVAVNAVLATALFRRELAGLSEREDGGSGPRVPLVLTLVHLLFLLGVVVFAHHPPLFLGLFLFFLGVAQAYERHQNRLILREGLLVAFFLAGLVVLGGLQQWWLQPLLMSMGEGEVFVGAILLTAITDNAALTYLGSLVEGLSDGFKYALVAGAVTGGGLTIIANAPNPAGISILKSGFADESVSPLGLLLAALPPTCIAAAAFWFL